MSKLIFVYLLIFFIFSQNYIFSGKAIVFRLKYAIPNEPTVFDPSLIVTYYSKNDIYTELKMGKPLRDLTVVLNEEDSSFILKDGTCPTESEYSISGSSTFKYDKGYIYQYLNNEFAAVLNNTREQICLNQADKQYFYSSLKDRRFDKYITKIQIDDFSFLYSTNEKERTQIAKREKEKEKNKQKDKNENKKDSQKTYDTDDEDYDNIYNHDDEYDNDDNPFTPFYPGEDDNFQLEPKCGYMGLLPQGIKTGLNEAKLNFIQQLKNKKIIDNYNWYIRYNKDKTGELIIGGAPHDIRPENYLEEDLYMTQAKLINDLFYWQIDFSLIELFDEKNNKKYNLGKDNGVISFNENFIHSSKEYLDNIVSIFFMPYIDRKICKLENIYKNNIMNSVIYCHQNFTENDLKKFPVLLLQSNDLNYIFNFDFNDLFLKTKNVYIFKIMYSGGHGYWKLGKIFLEKYPFVFNYDSKMFGFYQKFIPENIDGDIIIDPNYIPNSEKKGNDKLPPSKRKDLRDKEMINKEGSKSNVLKIIFIIILIIIVLLIAFYIVRKFIFIKQLNSNLIENKKYGKKRQKLDDGDMLEDDLVIN